MDNQNTSTYHQWRRAKKIPQKPEDISEQGIKAANDVSESIKAACNAQTSDDFFKAQQALFEAVANLLDASSGLERYENQQALTEAFKTLSIAANTEGDMQPPTPLDIQDMINNLLEYKAPGETNEARITNAIIGILHDMDMLTIPDKGNELRIGDGKPHKAGAGAYGGVTQPPIEHSPLGLADEVVTDLYESLLSEID